MQTETQTPTPSMPPMTDPMITVTESAAGKIRELLSEEGKLESGLRVFVQGGGCSGFQYGLMIEEGGGVGDQLFESNGVRLFVDPVTLPSGNTYSWDAIKRHFEARKAQALPLECPLTRDKVPSDWTLKVNIGTRDTTEALVSEITDEAAEETVPEAAAAWAELLVLCAEYDATKATVATAATVATVPTDLGAGGGAAGANNQGDAGIGHNDILRPG